MKIAVSAEQAIPESVIDTRFGRARCYMIFDDQEKVWSSIDNTQNLQAAQGAGIQSAANVVNSGCNVLISGHCGPKAFTALWRAGVEVYAVDGGTVEGAIRLYSDGKLRKLEAADVEGHW